METTMFVNKNIKFGITIFINGIRQRSHDKN